MLDKKTKDQLPSIIKDTMDALSGLTNAPDEMTLPITLAVANFAVQALHDVNPMAWKRCAVSEFFVVLVPSGGMKTSISDLLLQGMRKFEKEQEEIARQSQIEFLVETKKFNRDIDAAAKDPGLPTPIKPMKPKGFRYRVEKATVNGLINTLDTIPFAGLFSSDAGEFFNSHSFQDQSKSMEMVTTLSKAWSGEDLDRVTGIEDNNVRLHNRRFNMLVLLQQSLAGFLNNSAYKDQGFTNRMLITQCELTAKKAADFSEDGQCETDKLNELLDPFNRRVYQLLSDVATMQDAAKSGRGGLFKEDSLQKMQRLMAAANNQVNPNELVLTTIDFNKIDGARKVMQDFCNEMAKEAMGSKYAEYSNFMSRAYEHCCRLAATLALFDRCKEINLQYAECAVGLMRYFIEQRLNLDVDGTIKVNPIVECGEAVIKWLRKQDNNEASKQDLVQRGPNSYRKMDADGRVKVMLDLEARELIEIAEVSSGGTKTRHVVRVANGQ